MLVRGPAADELLSISMKKNKSFFTRFIQKFAEGLITLSGGVTSLAVILIVVYLFKESVGLFQRTTVAQEFVMAVHKSNSIDHLDATKIKLVFDQEITNWKQLGGPNDTIITFRWEDAGYYFTEEEMGADFENLPHCIAVMADTMTGMLAFIPKHYITNEFTGKILSEEKVSPGSFFFGKEWFPTAEPAAQLGVWPLIMGTLWVSLGAILLSLPLGLGVAIYLSEIASDKLRRVIKPLIELLAGIPSVVFGFFGLVIIVPIIQRWFDLPVGETALAGSVILAIMALPTIITIAEDAMRTVPRSMREASLALGASRWQTIYRVVVPYAASGISAAAILGVGRAVGETMAVLMVTGNAAIIPHSFFEPVRTIPATIAAELGEAPQGGIHYEALFTLGVILFVITLCINLLVDYLSTRKR